MLHFVSFRVVTYFESGTFGFELPYRLSVHDWFEILSGGVHGHSWVLLGVLHEGVISLLRNPNFCFYYNIFIHLTYHLFSFIF